MAYASLTYPANGVTETFAVPFNYLSKADVYVDINGVQVPFTWDNDSTVRLTPAPPNGTLVTLRRTTPGATKVVDYTDGVVLTEAELDASASQLLHLIQEQRDDFEALQAGAISGTTITNITNNATAGVLSSAQLLALEQQLTTLGLVAGGLTTTYFQNDVPLVGEAGDLWFDTDDGNRVYRHHGNWITYANNIDLGIRLTGRSLDEWRAPLSDWTSVPNSETDPFNVPNSADALTLSGGSGSALVRHHFAVPGANVGGDGLPYNVSLWVKVISGTVDGIDVDLNDATPVTLGVPAGTWQRLDVDVVSGTGYVGTGAPFNGFLDLKINYQGASAVVAVYGVQVTSGNGVKDFIPQTLGTDAQWMDVRDAGISQALTGMGANAAAIAQQTIDIATNAADILVAESDITALNAALVTTDGNVATNASAISANAAAIVSNGSAITGLASDVTQLQVDLGTTDGAVSANTGAINALDARVTVNEGDIVASASDITSLQTDVVLTNATIAASAVVVNDWNVDEVNAPYTPGGFMAHIRLDKANDYVYITGSARTCAGSTQLRFELEVYGASFQDTAVYPPSNNYLEGVEIPVWSPTPLDFSTATGRQIAPNGLAIGGGGSGGWGFGNFNVDGAGFKLDKLDDTVRFRLKITQLDGNTYNTQLLFGDTMIFPTSLESKIPLEVWLSPVDGTSVTAVNTAAISGLDTRVTTAEGNITATAADVTTLQTDLTTANGNITANANAISANAAAITANGNAITASAADITTLQSGLATTNGNVTGNANAISSLDTRVTSAEGTISAHTSDITGINASLTTTNNNVTANANAVSALDTRVTSTESGVSANASNLTSLTTTVGNNTTDISTLTSTTNGLEAQYTVKVDNNGWISGFGLASTPVNGVPFSEFTILADKFSVVIPGAAPGAVPVVPFVVDAGGVRFDGSLIVDGSIIGDHINGNTITANKLDIQGGISAITADLGTITSGLLKSQAGTGWRTEVGDNGGYVLWYGNGAKNDANASLYLKTDGTAVFKGDLSAAGGTFTGDLSAAGGTFTGDLSAAGGTFSGVLTAQAIDAVDTINIAGVAVTAPTSAFTAATIGSSNGTWVTAQSSPTISVTTVNGISPNVTLLATGVGKGAVVYDDDDPYVCLSLWRGNTLLRDFGQVQGTEEWVGCAVSYVDSPPDGNHVYHLKLRGFSDPFMTSAGSCQLHSRFLLALTTKR